jgi:hypothetical protein
MRDGSDRFERIHPGARFGKIVEFTFFLIEIPLAGTVQGLENIFDVIPSRAFLARSCVFQTEGRSTTERHSPVFEVDRLDRDPGFDPAGEAANLDVGEVFPVSDIPILENRSERTVMPGGLPARVDRLLEIINPFFGETRPGATFAVYEELAEIPFPLPDFGKIRDPCRMTVGLALGPVYDPPSAAEDGAFAGIGPVNDRGFFGSRVFRRKRDRFRDRVRTSSE